ncbi:PAS domain S-box protein [candidate division KSB3 bacterium]|uniref:histidine kinase n=1 Tax=candidate division KSB3 bacterium TaxID=2044937 RepID=A0A9D5JVN1_9BACT|nr:PAS domain S-box protein [candidate division KSB3 bacterium]
MTPPKILLVEDNFITSDEIRDWLMRLGYTEVATAYSGAEAVRLAEEGQPDLILMDIHLGDGIDGIEAAERIQARRRVPVLYLTAYDSDSTLSRAKLTNTSAYLLKPVRERELRIAIELALEKHQAEQALQASEEKFRNIFEMALDMICIADIDTATFLQVNPAFTTILGYQEEELLQRPFLDFIHPDDVGPTIEIIEHDLKHGANVISFTNRYRCKDGTYRWLDWNSHPYPAKGITYAIAHDITERKQAEEVLHATNAAKDKLFSIIGHDLRNPMIGLSSGTEMLREHLQDADAFTRDLCRQMHASIEQVLQLLDDLLAWSRVEQGTFPYAPEPLDLASHVNAVRTFLHEMAAQKQITVTTAIAPGTAVLADPNMLNTILRNLLSNALKFTPQGGTVTINAHKHETMVAISVSDTGVGMSAEKVKRLFNIGEKGISTAGTAGERGTGLGLILCKEFVECHGGQIWAESEKGAGSTFTLTLSEGKNSESVKRT